MLAQVQEAAFKRIMLQVFQRSHWCPPDALEYLTTRFEEEEAAKPETSPAHCGALICKVAPQIDQHGVLLLVFRNPYKDPIDLIQMRFGRVMFHVQASLCASAVKGE